MWKRNAYGSEMGLPLGIKIKKHGLRIWLS